MLRSVDGFAWVRDLKVDDSIYLDGDVVTCDSLLSRNLQRHDAEVHLAHGFDEGDEEEQARSACRDQTPKAEDHTAFVFLHNLDRGTDEHKEDDCDGANDHEHLPGYNQRAPSTPALISTAAGHSSRNAPSGTAMRPGASIGCVDPSR